MTSRPDTITFASPRAGSVRDAYGDPCPAATSGSYPLTATCEYCGSSIRCADGSAAWAHKRTHFGMCEA